MLAAVPASIAILLVATVGYLVGSVTIVHRIAQRHGVGDLRAVGDRNPGYWNARQQLGARGALPVFVVDTAKGALAAGLGVVVAVTTSGPWWLSWVGGGAAMVGHAWPLFAGFRGGRSVLTFVGAGLVCAPLAGAIAVAVMVAVWAGSRRFEWGARAGIVVFPVVELALDGPQRTAATGVLMTFVGLRFAQATWAELRRARSSFGRHR
jgi:glycerol-3-phosphate acyltransferase PlsY